MALKLQCPQCSPGVPSAFPSFTGCPPAPSLVGVGQALLLQPHALGFWGYDPFHGAPMRVNKPGLCFQCSWELQLLWLGDPHGAGAAFKEE